MAEIIEQGGCGDNLTWTLDNEGLLTISGEGKMNNYFFDSPFCGNTNITKVKISHGVTSIGSSAFEGCKALTNIEIPNSVTEIGLDAFSGCDALTSIEIPNSVTSIESWAFYGCEALTSIEIPNSVTNIGYGAFALCEALTNLHIRCEHPEDLEIDEEAFYKTNIESCTLYVPIRTGYAYRHHPVFSKFKEVIIEK
ncbi:MAG: leucine-rich repeat domain-containing protein [Paludibacteraceae bacterium]|nr:leucine-rich repeat domain-containing protein [Paludibacteraceae bacterium]